MTASADYYSILSLPASATAQQIRDAYKRAALKTHPDRVPADSPERPVRTRQFQRVNDAYYTLSDAGRRREYDAARRAHGGFFGGAGREDAMPGEFDFDADLRGETTGAGGGGEGGGGTGSGNGGGGTAGAGFGFPWSAFGFGAGNNGGTTGTGTTTDPDEAKHAHDSAQFGDVFEEMLRDEGMAEGEAARPTGKFWSVVGGLSGGAMGFIVANFPGMLAGAVAGNRLGAVRDARGKSVYAVFQELPQGDKAALLAQLAAKVFSHAVGV